MTFSSLYYPEELKPVFLKIKISTLAEKYFFRQFEVI